MSSIHTVTARAYLTRPAYDVSHPAETFWSTSFDLSPYSLASVGFTASPGAGPDGSVGVESGASYAARTGAKSAYPGTKLYGSSAGTATATFTKTLTGLSIGRSYTFSLWAKVPATSDWTTDQARVGVQGIGNSSYVTLSTSWQQISYTFTATTTFHSLVITGNETDAAATDSSFMVDDLSVVKNAWVEHFSAVTSWIDLPVKDAQLTKDDGWNPYVQTTLTCSLLEEQYLEFVDPRNDVRIEVGMYRDGVGTLEDLVLRSRSIDHEAAELTITAGSDEYLLMDRARVNPTNDTSYLAYQGDLRGLVNQVLTWAVSSTLETDAGATADLTIYSDSTNLVRNPSAETDTTTWGAVSCTLTRLASSATGVVGANRFRIQTPTDPNSYMYTDVTVSPGETYVFSGNWILNGSTSGAPHSLARKLMVSNGSTQLAASNAAVTSGDRVYGEVTIPSGVTTVRLRAYHGYTTSGDIGWDALKFVLKDGSTSDTTYFDGTTTDTASYTYDWTGTTNLSTSTRTNLTGKDWTDDMFTWTPGVSAWDFVSPLVEAAGLRLYCDGERNWHLVNPATWLIPTTVELEGGVNLTQATDSIDRSNDTWYDSVVIKYSWLNKKNVPQVKYDTAGLGGKVLFLERERAWPGPGAANAILSRASMKGRVLDLSAISDYTVEPGMDFEATLPATPLQTGVISAVTWAFPDDEMTLKTRET